eukprot:scaffold20356_cov125-Isochrysis_galbana.AAC.14
MPFPLSGASGRRGALERVPPALAVEARHYIGRRRESEEAVDEWISVIRAEHLRRQWPRSITLAFDISDDACRGRRPTETSRTDNDQNHGPTAVTDDGQRRNGN